MTKIIAICGFKGSGKDEVAKRLPDAYVNLKFAGPLKDMIRVLFEAQGMSGVELERYIEGDMKEIPSEYLNGKTSREAQQTIGTEWGRDLISPTLWADILERSCEHHDFVVVTDMRFPNEFELMERLGAITVRVERAGQNSNEFSDHPSERYISTFDVGYVIDNDGSLDDLDKKVSELLTDVQREEDFANGGNYN